MGKGIYLAYIGIMLLLNISIFLTPVLAFKNDPLASGLYHDVFVYFCHQKISRSLCLFEGPDGYFVADCIPQAGVYAADSPRQISTIQGGWLGYKFPVCSRDVAIYLAMLIFGLVYPLRYRLENKELPDAVYLIAALIPIGIDGGLQLVSNLGFELPIIGMYESTNFWRVVTGFIAGAVLPFYLLPILNRVFEGKNLGKELKTEKTKGLV